MHGAGASTSLAHSQIYCHRASNYMAVGDSMPGVVVGTTARCQGSRSLLVRQNAKHAMGSPTGLLRVAVSTVSRLEASHGATVESAQLPAVPLCKCHGVQCACLHAVALLYAPRIAIASYALHMLCCSLVWLAYRMQRRERIARSRACHHLLPSWSVANWVWHIYLFFSKAFQTKYSEQQK